MAQEKPLLAACGGETVKLFDVSERTRDPCTFQYTPAPGCQVNCARWNHTNMVVASAGEDHKISLWMKDQVVAVVPQPGEEVDDFIDESILAICFSSKGSRYLGSGGTGKIVRVWDLQRKRCIKWLKGHTDTITGVMYNCRDEHLASISLKGDLIVHNLASGTRAVELKDPHDQVLRVMEYSRLSRHLLLTAGDDGTVHLWDSTARSPKLSWIKQHSAPTTGVCFSPTSDKMIVSVGLDKKLYIYDPGVKKPVYSVPYDAPFSSLAFRDDGNTLAVGTNSGCVVFFDMRGRPQPFTILRAYSSSEAVTSLSWQCSNPIAVTGSNCSLEVALLGTSSEDSVIMPDPLPASGLGTRGRIPAAVGSTKPSTWASSLPNNDNPTNRIGASGIGGSSVAGGITTRPKSAGGDITPFSSSRIWANGPISRLQTPRTTSFYNGIDDMEVFSPLVDVQPITPSISSFWDRETSGIESAGESTAVGGDSSSRRSTFGSPASAALRRFPSIEDMEKEQRRLSLGSSQDGTQKRTSFDSPATSTPVSGALSKMERSPSLTPPEAWGGEPLEKGSFRQQPPTMSRFALGSALRAASAIPSSRLDSLATTVSGATVSNGQPHARYTATLEQNLRTFPSREMPPRPSLDQDTPVPVPNGSSGIHSSGPEQTLLDTFSGSAGELPSGSSSGGTSPRQRSSDIHRRYERVEVPGSVDGKGEFENGVPPRSDAAISTGASSPGSNGYVQGSIQRISLPQEPVQQQGGGATSFALQLVQRGLEETLGSVQQAIHEDVQNLHLELLRQFHIQQMEMASMMDLLLVKQAEQMEEIKALRRENQQLRDLY